jgi:hypothetical protein
LEVVIKEHPRQETKAKQHSRASHLRTPKLSAAATTTTRLLAEPKNKNLKLKITNMNTWLKVEEQCPNNQV